MFNIEHDRMAGDDGKPAYGDEQNKRKKTGKKQRPGE